MGGLLMICALAWLYFDPEGLALFISTIVDNASSVILALSDQLRELFETFANTVGTTGPQGESGEGVGQ